MEKVVQYLEDLSKSDKKLYAKTRTRLGDLNTQLCHSVELISQILADNMLKQDTEFGENLGELKEEATSINKDIISAAGKAAKLNNFISNDTKSNKGIMTKYKEVARLVASSNIKYSQVDSCAKIIYKWIECRFYNSHNKDFKYQLEMVPHWIADIIILYGYCLSKNDFSDIVALESWCNDVNSGVISTPYAVPYCVHKISHNMGKEFVTFSGLGLYDLLLDAGYRDLDSPELGDIKLSEYLVKDKFSYYAPEVVDDYTYCGDDESLLKKYKIVGG